MSNAMRFHFDEHLLEYWKTQPAQRGANFDTCGNIMSMGLNDRRAPPAIAGKSDGSLHLES